MLQWLKIEATLGGANSVVTLTWPTYAAAEQALSKADNIFHEWIKLPQVTEDDIENTEIQLSLAFAKYGKFIFVPVFNFCLLVNF